MTRNKEGICDARGTARLKTVLLNFVAFGFHAYEKLNVVEERKSNNKTNKILLFKVLDF